MYILHPKGVHDNLITGQPRYSDRFVQTQLLTLGNLP